MKTQAQIIKNSLNSIFVKKVMHNKGWNKSQAAEQVLGWLTCGKKISLHDYLIAA